MEIYRQDGDAFCSIRATFDANDNLQINGQDMGPLVEQFFGDSDYEYYLTIPKNEVKKFTLEILKKAFNQNEALGYYDLIKVCDANKIKYSNNYWA